jgi:hypothetical protein
MTVGRVRPRGSVLHDGSIADLGVVDGAVGKY